MRACIQWKTINRFCFCDRIILSVKRYLVFPSAKQPRAMPNLTSFCLAKKCEQSSNRALSRREEPPASLRCHRITSDILIFSQTINDAVLLSSAVFASKPMTFSDFSLLHTVPFFLPPTPLLHIPTTKLHPSSKRQTYSVIVGWHKESPDVLLLAWHARIQD